MGGLWPYRRTQPKSKARAQRSARPWSAVQTEEASPNSTPLAIAIASASSAKGCTVITGPKIWTRIISCTGVLMYSCEGPTTTVFERCVLLQKACAATDLKGVYDY